MKRARRFVWVAAMCGVLLLGFLVGVERSIARLAAQRAGSLNAPAAWVPFVADLSLLSPTSPPVTGKFYRRQDGSTRTESGPSRDDIRVVFIQNTAQARLYTYTQTASGPLWVTEPWHGVVPGHYLPPVTLARGITWSELPTPVDLMRPGTSGYHRVRAIESSSSDGLRKTIVPELNLFVSAVRRPDGHAELYSNVELVTPQDALFSPPDGARLYMRQPQNRH